MSPTAVLGDRSAEDAAWAGITAQANRLKALHMRDLFVADKERFARYSLSACGLLLDYSKEKIDDRAMLSLLSLAQVRRVEATRDAMFSGQIVNCTEDRPALHVALRAAHGERFEIDGHDVVPDVLAAREHMFNFAEDIREGRIRAHDGAPFTDLLSIGIGGSDLGPRMAAMALTPDCDGPRAHFLSNIDSADLHDTLRRLDPARTLVIVQSKSFTTAETITNANSVRTWLVSALGDDVSAHLAAVSCETEKAVEFGVPEERVFGFWDWVGGRYSIWSVIGLPLAISIGARRFAEMLSGGREMDQHFRMADLASNLPILYALVGVWRRNAMGCPALAVIPYEQRLSRFPAYLQQLDMESNGKGVRADGRPVERGTGPIVFGEPGTNSQHSFFQHLHQGPDIIPIDFLVGAEPRERVVGHRRMLLANCFAQSQALAFGRTEAEARAAMAEEGLTSLEIDALAPHRTFAGDRPSTTIVYRTLDARTLGALIALYEHKVFVQSAIWGTNPFDQWGVELGKVLAKRLHRATSGEGDLDDLDSSTRGLIETVFAMRDET